MQHTAKRFLTAAHTARRKKRSFTGNSARTSARFFGDVFSQDKASKPPLYTHTARRKKRSFTGNSARTSARFFGDVFSQDKENERRRTSVLRVKFDAVFGKISPNLNSFFGDVFSQDKENERRRTSVLQAKFDAVLRKNSPKNQISIMSASFFFAISSISLTYLSVIF